MKLFFIPLVAAVLFASCAGAPNSSEAREVSSIPNFSEVSEREWKLIEVYVDGELYAGFSRDTPINEGFGEIFTLSFDAESVSGIGAPNRYSAPYSLGDERSISILLLRSTLMASIFEPEGLSEHEFFNYMQNVYEWKLENGNLHLLTRTEESGEVVLVFSLQ